VCLLDIAKERIQKILNAGVQFAILLYQLSSLHWQACTVAWLLGIRKERFHRLRYAGGSIDFLLYQLVVVCVWYCSKTAGNEGQRTHQEDPRCRWAAACSHTFLHSEVQAAGRARTWVVGYRNPKLLYACWPAGSIVVLTPKGIDDM
jgi:hypothetical protein